MITSKNKKKRPPKRRAKKQSKLSKILSSSKEPYRVRHKLFADLSPGEILSNFEKLAHRQQFTPLIKLTSSGGCSNFYNSDAPNTNLEKSLYWITGLLLHHSDKINKFLHQENLLTGAILDEKTSDAISILDDIDSECGISTWSIGIRCSLLQLSGDPDGVKNFLEELDSNHNFGSFFKSVRTYVSDRFDSSTLIISSGNALRNQILRSIEGGLKNFLIYKIVPRDYTPDLKLGFADILNYEKNSSIIDLFKGVINYFGNTIGTGNPEQNKIAKKIVDRLSTKIDCYIIKSVCAFYGIEQQWSHDQFTYSMIDQYSAGEYIEVCNKAKSDPRTYLNFTCFELVSKSSAKIGHSPYKGLKKELIDCLVSVYLKDEDYHHSLAILAATTHAFSDLPWFQELHYLISRESSFIKQESIDRLIILSSIFSPVNTPRKSLSIAGSIRHLYFESCQKNIKNSLSIKLFEISNRNDVARISQEEFPLLEQERLLKYRSDALIKIGLISQAVPLLENLVNSTDKIVSYDSLTKLVTAYINTDLLEEALNLFVTSVLENRNLVTRFDTTKICDVAKSLINTSNSINIPLSLSLHTRFVNPQFESALRYSFEKFLTINQFQHPLELISDVSLFDKKAICYYLEHVCTLDLMKLSFLFEDEKEIQDCRISVCAHLIDQNISKELLANEVKELTKEQLITKAISHVNHSRVYADLSGFRDNRSRSFRSIFERYTELSKNDYSSYDDETSLHNIYKVLDENQISSQWHSLYVLEITLNEKNSTFHKLISNLRDEFTFGTKGLNSYLSTRIRHGVLPSTIRQSVIEENLISSIQSNLNTTKTNEFWKAKLSELGESNWRAIDKEIGKFTIDFEKAIHEINDDWLQIASLDQDIKAMQAGGSKDKALFNYSISNVETYALQKLTTEDDYDEFIQAITQWLWRRTEENLNSVKEKILTDGSAKFEKCFSSLSESISQYTGDQTALTSLHDAIGRSREKLQSALSLISSWFTLDTADDIKKFEIGTAIEIATRPLNINVDVDNKSQGSYFKGEYLSNVVDILYILFENAVTKSNVPKQYLNIHVTYLVSPEIGLYLEVTNNCAPLPNIKNANSELDFYRDLSRDDELVNAVSQEEGGTGLFKIKKILSKDMETDHRVFFEFSSKELFCISITINEPNEILSHENSIC